MHGGIGEDGTLQALLEAEGISYTGIFMLTIVARRICLPIVSVSHFTFSFSTVGPGVIPSKTCMDKVATSLALNHVWQLIFLNASGAVLISVSLSMVCMFSS